MTTTYLMTAFLLLIGGTALSVAPTPKQVKSVSDYYYNGEKNGPMLLEFKPCLDVEQNKKSSHLYECNKTASASVKVGTKLTAWTSWMVPKKGLYNDVMIQFVHDGIVRSTQDIRLDGGLRKRAFRSQVISKPGAWEIRVLKDRKVLASSKLNAVK